MNKKNEHGAHVFDEALQKANEWLHEILEVAGWTNPHTAYSALRATLHTLRDRLPADEAVDFASELPMLIRGLFFEGWKPTNKPDKSMKTLDDFYNRVLEHFKSDQPVHPDKVVSSVLIVLAKRMSFGEIRQIQKQLPEKMREIWPPETISTVTEEVFI
ncbi:MAG: hypothetical protein JWQ35_959 [Bacteriovoracaceae bacterium]|nr:hypothetical protein [Bacteriovoracaceae bacterium]